MLDGEVILFGFESASARLKFRNGTYWVTNLYSRKRGLGHATRLMELISEYADAQDLTLYLQVRSSTAMANEGIMNNDQLLHFYDKLGYIQWQKSRPSILVRYPERRTREKYEPYSDKE